MKKFTNIILVIIFLAGLSLILYPSFSDWWNSMHQSRAVAAYIEQAADFSSEKSDKMYEEAVAYNEKLAESSPNYMLSDEEREEYLSVLDVTGTGIMGYLEIPKINVLLPIYHGTENTVLQIATGHIEGTSLPVGGESTHTVISGHSGLPSAKLLTDLNKLERGDQFIITVLDRTLTYEVDQFRTVLPDELDDLKIEEGEDYCTLITCTPYGINTHRLLVRGHRVENAAGEVRVTADALQVKTTAVALAIGLVLALFVLLFFIQLGRTEKRAERAAVEQALKEYGKRKKS